MQYSYLNVSLFHMTSEDLEYSARLTWATLKKKIFEKYIKEQRGHWQHADRQDRAGYFWYKTMSQL